MSTSTTPATADAAILIKVTTAGGATSPAARRRASRNQVRTPNAVTTAIMTTQLHVVVRLPLEMLLMTSSLMGCEPPWPSINNITPCHPSKPASVTTNDGRPNRVMIVPCNRPISAQTTSPARIDAHQGQPTDSFTNSAITMPPMPLTKPIDRSISPSNSANTSPIASSM